MKAITASPYDKTIKKKGCCHIIDKPVKNLQSKVDCFRFYGFGFR